MGFPGGSEVKVSACNVGDLGSIPGSGRSPGEGNGNPLQCSWTGESGRLQSTGLQRVGHDFASLHMARFNDLRRSLNYILRAFNVLRI